MPEEPQLLKLSRILPRGLSRVATYGGVRHALPVIVLLAIFCRHGIQLCVERKGGAAEGLR